MMFCTGGFGRPSCINPEGIVMIGFDQKISFLSAAAEKSPEYAEIVPVFIEIQRFLASYGDETGISFTITDDNQREKTAEGFPLLSATDLQVDQAQTASFLAGLLQLLKSVGRSGEAELTKIEQASCHGDLDYLSLFRAILERNRAALDEAATALSVPSPLLEYIGEIPLRHALELFATGCSNHDLSGWEEGYCPICGSRAGMAEFAGEEGKRFLSCSACSFAWPFKRLKCPFCTNEDPEKLTYFTIDDGPTRVDVCKKCSRYIKTRDSRKGNSDVPLDVEDIMTMHLDLIASREGLERGK